MRRWLGACAGTLLAVGAGFTAPAWGQAVTSGGTPSDPLLAHFLQTESGGNWSATNPDSTSSGGFQLTQAALADAGILKINSPPTVSDFGSASSWNNVTFLPNAYGITSRQAFLNASPATQTAVEKSFLGATWQQEQSLGLTSYVGQTVNGQTINQSALLGCGELLGASGCQQYLSTGSAGNAALTDTAIANIAADSQVNSSSITGANQAVTDSQPGVPVNASANSAGYGMYCNQTFSNAIATQAQRNVAAQVAMAEAPSTGYSLADGSSILNPGGNGYGALSCLKNLFNKGLNVLFEPPNINSILSSLVNASCAMANNYINEALVPLNKSFYKSSSLGGFFPAIGMGASVGVSGTPGVTLGSSGVTNSTSGQISVPVNMGGVF